MQRSKFASISIRDLGKGLLITVLSTVLLALKTALDQGGLSIFTDTQQLLGLLELASSAGIGYILTNFFENSQGKLGRREGR